ncbi:MAG: hypothetical protein FGM46_02595 [Ferruginibacter sp.]|nr:hypothetical protein [Ferruginibacter sp.]
MKNFIVATSTLFILFLNTFKCISQSISSNQAIVKSTLNISSTDEEDIQDQGRESGRMGMRNMMEGEIKLTNYTKNTLSKMVIESDFINSSVYRDESQKTTTTIMEIMGQKLGFYTNDDEMAKMIQTRDSLIRQKRSAENDLILNPDVSVSITQETKTIAGFACKKAYVITKKPETSDTAVIWFTSEIKLQNSLSTSSRAIIGMIPGLPGAFKKMEKIDGFITKCEISLPRGLKMEMEVNKIDLKSDISDNEFQLPRNVDIKPMSEMRNMFGGMFRGGM